LNGEVIVVLTTDREERVAPGSRLVSDRGPLVVSSARGQRTGARPGWIVHFEGLSDRFAADALRGLVLRAEPIDDPDELWAHQVVGADVVVAGSGERVGRCVALVANPAADLLELDSGALVPVVFVVDVQPPAGDGGAAQVTVDPPDGLFDL
jgi:16S rRNA processing protein RimM